MNNSSKKRVFASGKLREILFLCALALVLVIATWKIFYTNDNEEPNSIVTATESEKKVSRILEQIDGVGDADVMICETEEGVQSVVVVCDGANDLQTIMTVREAVAAALGTEQKAVKIYPKK